MSDPQRTDFDAASLVDKASAAGVWRLDREASKIAFAVKHFWGLITVRGTFDDLDGSAIVEPDGIIVASLTVHAGSVNTHRRARDKHLRSPVFFDVERYSTFEVKAHDIRLTSPTIAFVRADMLRAGIALPVTFDAKLALTPDDAQLAVDATVDVDRTAFGITWSPLRMAAEMARVTVRLVFRHTNDPTHP